MSASENQLSFARAGSSANGFAKEPAIQFRTPLRAVRLNLRLRPRRLCALLLGVFSLAGPAVQAVTLVSVLEFGGAGTGFNPDYENGGGMIRGSDGYLYGATVAGGQYTHGTIFKTTTNGDLTTLHSFNGPVDGRGARGSLLEGSPGVFYGTTSIGGTNSRGTIFRVTSNGVFTVLHSFNLTDGASSTAGLVAGDDGNFYGTTTSGGSHLLGTVFRLTPAGGFTSLYSFGGSVDRGSPYGPMLPSGDGDFFGTTGSYTSSTGTNNYGTIFRVTTNGVVTTVYYLSGLGEEKEPYSLVRARDGNLYGLTAGNNGTVFRLTTNGTYATRHTFAGGPTDARNPRGLVEGQNGQLFGTTGFGGDFNRGAVFMIGTNSGLTVLASFDTAVGTLPQSRLLETEGANFYGTTFAFSGQLYRFGLYPEVRTQPLSRTNAIGTTATLAAAVDTFPPATYQWRKNGTNLVDGGHLSGTTNAQLILSPVTLTDASDYSLLVIDAFGSVTTTVATLTVVDLPPGILSQPHGSTNLAGSPVTFSVAAEGSLPLSYQWQRNSGNLTNDANLSGATSNTLTLDAALPADSGLYSVIVSNHLGSVTSSNAVLRVLPVMIISEPANQTNFVGDSLELNVYAYGDYPLTYQWQKDSMNLNDGPGISGAASNDLVFSSLTLADAGNYALIVSNHYGAVTTPVFVVMVLPTVPLAVALNAPELIWTTSPTSPWIGQTNVSHDGVSAGKSGRWQSWVETTVAGPGALTFWWKLATPLFCANLDFLTNGSLQARLNQPADWQMQTVAIPAGNQVLRWAFSVGECGLGPLEGGFLDEVTFVSAAPPVFQSVARSGNSIRFTWSAVTGRSYQIQSTTKLVPPGWTNLGGPIVATNTLATASDLIGPDATRYYRVFLVP